MTNHYLFNSPIGILKLSETQGKITGLNLVPGSDATLPPNHRPHPDLLYEAWQQVEEYFAGNRTTFDLPLHYSGTPFQQQVWSALQNIPYGETRSYADIAININNPRALRAVGQANNKNPIMIIIPCHRVINKNGTIGGFGCGIDAKKYLLTLEQAHYRGSACLSQSN